MSDKIPIAPSRVYAYMSAISQVAPFGWNTVHLDTILFDGLGEFDTALYRFTPKRAGYYLIISDIAFNVNAVNTFYLGSIRRTGAVNIANDGALFSALGFQAYLNSHVIYHLTPNDYIDLRFNNGAVANTTINGLVNLTYLSIHRLS